MSETMFEQDPQSEKQSEQSTAPETETKTKPMFNAFVEHQAAAAREAAQALQALIPPDFRTHSRAARKEFLTSFKVLLDGVSEVVDREVEKARQASASKTDAKKPDDSDKPPTTGKSKVKVEVL
jgi:hypothetical protein